MSLKKFDNYADAENWLVEKIVRTPDFITDATHEIFGTGFVLTRPEFNQNKRSNYDYAEAFFQWLLTGSKTLSQDLLSINPWVERFVSTKGLPDSFSASYGWKLKEQEDDIKRELQINRSSRRAYINILYKDDHIITKTKTTHEYPCTIGLHFFIREDKLYLMTNMRSNNVYAVMPYDVYNFTEYLLKFAKDLKIDVGHYIHQINNAHIYKGDIRRIMEKRIS